MKILSVNTSDTGGGAAHAAYRIHQGVRQMGVDSRMFVKNKGTDDPNIYALSDFVPANPVYRLFDWCAKKIKNQIQHSRWNKYPNRDSKYKSDLRSTCIHGALQAIPYDILHLHWINQRFLSIDELCKVHKPIVWTLHDSWPFCGVCHYFLDCEGYQHQCGQCPQLGSSYPDDLSHQVWMRKAEVYKDLDLHIVTPSRWLADCARKSSLFRNVDIHVIPNGLDTDLFHPMTNEEIKTIAETQKETAVGAVLHAAIKKKDANPTILYGAVNAATDPIKGFDNLLSALHILDAQGFEAHLVVFGADKTELPMHFEHISVTFVGYIHDFIVLAALYSMADVVVVPSATENLSYAIMESLSCGTPVVAFNIGGNGDMIVHQQNGYLAKRNNDRDLANGIEWSINNDADKLLSHNAREKVVSHFAQEIVAEQYLDLYNKIVNGN